MYGNILFVHGPVSVVKAQSDSDLLFDMDTFQVLFVSDRLAAMFEAHTGNCLAEGMSLYDAFSSSELQGACVQLQNAKAQCNLEDASGNAVVVSTDFMLLQHHISQVSTLTPDIS